MAYPYDYGPSMIFNNKEPSSPNTGSDKFYLLHFKGQAKDSSAAIQKISCISE
jgi:hypothetical protein